MSIVLNDGNTIPWLAFGTGSAQFARDCSGIVRLAIAHGITHLDGAQMYRNEDKLGLGIEASRKPRSELFVTTKLTSLGEGETVEASLRRSLQKLKLEFVDLFLIHSPLQNGGRIKQLWKEMEQVQKLGLTKSIGVSNFKAEHLEEILDGASVVPAVNQIEYHPYVFEAAAPIVELCKKQHIAIAAYAVLTPIVYARGGPLDPVLATLCERLEKTCGSPVTEAQVLLKWLNQQGIVIVTTTSKESRMGEYLNAANVPDLTPEEIQAISDSGIGVHMRIYGRSIFGE